jgi:3-isopropylmalate/(R)-2-methylmalate dehydratase small subunit
MTDGTADPVPGSGPGGASRIWRFGDGIDTDAMAPGQYMKLGIDELARHCLEGVRPEFSAAVRPGDLVVAGRNFGIGSSREQAPQALARLGVAAVIAVSFAGLFYRNAINLGLPVLVCPDAGRLQDGEAATLDLEAATLVTQGGLEVEVEPMPQFLLDIVRSGGLIAHLQRTLSPGS